MIGLIQRVARAQVTSGGRCLGAIERGTLALIGVRPGDDTRSADRLLERLLAYRIFADAAARMNRSLRETGGGLLLVPQFTLAADTSGGNRPGFSGAAPPEQGRALYEAVLRLARERHAPVGQGEFGADMQVTLVNDGPVTIPLRIT